MLDTDRRTPSRRRIGRPAKLTLAAVAVLTLLAGGTALADESTLSGTHAGHASADSVPDADAQTGEEAAGPEQAEEAEGAAEGSEAADTSGPENAAQGVHGACVSAVAKDKSTVGREHGAAVSAAAHSCARGAKGAEKSAAGKAKGAEKSAAGKAHRTA